MSRAVRASPAAAVAALASLALAPATAAPAKLDARCADVSRGELVRIAEATGPDEVRLDDGRHVRLVSVAGPWSPLAGPQRGADLGGLAGRARDRLGSLASDWDFRLIGRGTDRHGRVTGDLVRVVDRVSLAATLVDEGLARVEPDGDGCARGLLGLEAKARAAGAGLWAEAAFAPVAAADARLVASQGSYALVEGRVVSVGHSGTRTYINFGSDLRRDFAVVIDDKNRAAIEAAGFGSQRLEGRTIRVRGIVSARDPAARDDEGGARIRVTVPEQIEWVQR